jgi:hypothetical protein
MRGNGAIFNMNNAYLGRRHTCSAIGPDTWLIQATAPLNMARRYNALDCSGNRFGTRAN